MPRKDKVLILTNKEDITADYVILELQKRNINYFRFNTEDFPANIKGVFTIDNKKSSASFQTPKGIINLNEIRAVWYRRPGFPSIAKDITDKGIREFCQKEAEEFLEGIWSNFTGLWVSYPPSIFQAQNKLYQLRLAKDIGFKIPETIVTNDPEKVFKFLKNIGSTIVIKAVRQGALTVDGFEHVIYTNPIKKNDLEVLSDIKYSPAIFQKFIDKKFDLRVTIVENDVFPVEIHFDPTDIKSKFDWRQGDQEKIFYKIHDLPNSIEKLCKSIIKRMNLKFGAIDLVYSNYNEYYFLEINPNGQWAWIEQTTGLNITESIVNLLESK